ncbi:hypothetical protein [uncultured Hydrogenophaga sp.]|uniref:hypothetical protein n=1 Tax=uncultured Hydrogenophaga sp. TaxID=199683 RepID=UPI00258F5E57|nr:hypothetical protein [uncultured Hydrogenophaga sp.]
MEASLVDDSGDMLVAVYFSDVFKVDEKVIDDYGAFNVALVNDLPLFVDPFLLFDSEGDKYKQLHDSIIDYLVFLKERVLEGELSDGDTNQWLLFKEVKQNWLGFSAVGNGGTGLGPSFARSLALSLRTVFRDFGSESATASSHLEKLGLLSTGVGRDHLSDFTTNLVKGFLLEYTQTFAVKHLHAGSVRKFRVDKVRFDYETRRWTSEYFQLPYFNGDYVLLTPKDILTREDAWINQGDMLSQFTEIQVCIPDEGLRQRVSDHFVRQIDERTKANERKEAMLRTISAHPEVLDVYIRMKEVDAPGAHAKSDFRVKMTQAQFVENVQQLARQLQELRKQEPTEAGDTSGDALEEARRRVVFLKKVIEDNDGYRLFYVDGTPVKRESDLQTMFRLTWCATAFDVNAEVNNGRGPVDYKISDGKSNAALVEFKLASNTSLEKNLRNQVAVYQKASNTKRALKVILHFSDSELDKVNRILKSLGLAGNPDVILIDASRANKPSASKA